MSEIESLLKLRINYAIHVNRVMKFGIKDALTNFTDLSHMLKGKFDEQRFASLTQNPNNSKVILSTLTLMWTELRSSHNSNPRQNFEVFEYYPDLNATDLLNLRFSGESIHQNKGPFDSEVGYLLAMRILANGTGSRYQTARLRTCYNLSHLNLERVIRISDHTDPVLWNQFTNLGQLHTPTARIFMQNLQSPNTLDELLNAFPYPLYEVKIPLDRSNMPSLSS